MGPWGIVVWQQDKRAYRKRRRCFHQGATPPGLTKWCRRKQGVSSKSCCSYFAAILRCGFNRRDPATPDPSQHGSRDRKQKSYQSKCNIPPHIQNPATSKRPYVHRACNKRGGGAPSPTWPPEETAEPGPGQRTRTTEHAFQTVPPAQLAAPRQSPVAFATSYRWKSVSGAGASLRCNRDRTQAPGGEPSPTFAHGTGAVYYVRNCSRGRR